MNEEQKRYAHLFRVGALSEVAPSLTHVAAVAFPKETRSHSDQARTPPPGTPARGSLQSPLAPPLSLKQLQSISLRLRPVPGCLKLCALPCVSATHRGRLGTCLVDYRLPTRSANGALASPVHPHEAPTFRGLDFQSLLGQSHSAACTTEAARRTKLPMVRSQAPCDD